MPKIEIVNFSPAQAETFPNGQRIMSGEGGVLDLKSICNELFGDQFGIFSGHVPTGPALAYLIRRFGYPISGSDDDKEICSYWLTTPDPLTFVDVSVRGTKVDFIPAVPQKVWEGSKLEQEAALTHCRVTLQSLLVPVFVRDRAINILGEVDENTLPLIPDPDDANEMISLSVEPHPSAGYAVPRDWWADPEAYWKARA